MFFEPTVGGHVNSQTVAPLNALRELGERRHGGPCMAYTHGIRTRVAGSETRYRRRLSFFLLLLAAHGLCAWKPLLGSLRPRWCVRNALFKKYKPKRGETPAVAAAVPKVRCLHTYIDSKHAE